MDPLQLLFVEVLFGSPPSSTEPEALRPWLTGLGIEPPDVEALLVSDLSGLFCYRELTRQTLIGACQRALPCTLARLGARFDDDFASFLLERGTRTHFLREVVQEFLAWALPRWQADVSAVPSYIPDLARHEALHFELASVSTTSHAASALELELDAPLRFSAACRVARYAFAVHRLPAQAALQTLPEAVPTNLLVYRSPEHEIRYLELSPLGAAILEALLAGATLRHAVEGACAAAGVLVDSSVIDGTSETLADLAARGVLLQA